MTNPVRLILRRDPVPRGAMGPVKARTPDVAVVYATATGEVAVFSSGDHDRWSRRVFARYQMRYEVDLGDHRRTLALRSAPLPARGGVYHFDTTFDVGFRVVDPGKIVSRDVDDGLMVVSNYLIDVCRPITRQIDILDAADAEDAINARFRGGDVLDEGIQLYRCRARVSSDTYARTFLKSQDDAKRGEIVKFARHGLAVADANRQIQLDEIKQRGRLTAQDRERQALADRPLDMEELIRTHLAREPRDTRMALQLLADMQRARWERQEIQNQRVQQMFEFLASRNLLHAVDLVGFRDQVMGQLQSKPGSLPTAGGPSPSSPIGTEWDEPLPMVGAASARSVPVSTVADGSLIGPPSGPPPRQSPDVLPVYVVIDQSVALEGCVTELNAGVNSLCDALIRAPEVADIVRLSVFGYADDVAVALALAVVRDGIERLPLSTHGQAHYAAAFERLLQCIPRDIEQLKAQQSNVRRPQVLFLSGAQPADESHWGRVYRQLVDRDQHRYAPDIVACGVGAARAETIVRIATRQELAFVADNGQLARSVEQYFSFVARQVISYGRSVLDGGLGPLVSPPDGFRPAIDRV